MSGPKSRLFKIVHCKLTGPFIHIRNFKYFRVCNIIAIVINHLMRMCTCNIFRMFIQKIHLLLKLIRICPVIITFQICQVVTPALHCSFVHIKSRTSGIFFPMNNSYNIRIFISVLPNNILSVIRRAVVSDNYFKRKIGDL